MATLPSGEQVAILLLILVILARRTYGMIRGAVVDLGRLAAVTALYVVLWLLVVLGGLLSLPWYSVAIDAAIAAATAVLMVPLVERRVTLERRPDGRWFYRLPVAVPLAYTVLFGARLAIDFLVLGTTPFTYPPPSGGVSANALLLVSVVDALFSFSTGLMVARGIAVYRVYGRRVEPPGPPTSGTPLA